jgi:hypothetical protein
VDACGAELELFARNERDPSGGRVDVCLYDGHVIWEYRRDAETPASIDQMRDIILKLLNSGEAETDVKMAS